MKKTLYVSIVFAFVSIQANAELFKITNRQYGSVPQEAVDRVFDALENTINASLPDTDTSNYLEGAANSTVLSTSGLGADYASPFSTFLVGVKLSAAGDLGNNSISDVTGGDAVNSLGGAAAQASVIIGFKGSIFSKRRKAKLGFIRLDRLRFYLSFFTFSSTFDSVTTDFTSFGLHAQYAILPPRSTAAGFLRWGGLKVGTGLKKSGINIGLTQSFTESSTDPGPPEITSTFDGTVTVAADIDIYSMPIEISTSVNFLYAISLYTGFGVDLAFGSSNSAASLSGPVTVSDSGVSGDATLDLGSDTSPDFFSGRLFAGFQIDLGVTNIYAQYNQSFTNNTIGANVGLNFYW